MRKLSLSNPSFRYLEKSFEEWLEVQGYAPSTVYNLPAHVRELLFYLEEKGINQIKELSISHIEEHYNNLRQRSNQRQGGGLSNAHLNKHIQAMRKFTQYLRKVGRLEIPEVYLRDESTDSKIVWLNLEEIKELYAASDKVIYRYNLPTEIIEALRARDKAMMAVYYGCGLRRTEGVHLDVGDVYFDSEILHVRQGKNYKERMVPINRTSLLQLQGYVYDHRPKLLKGAKTEALFLSRNSPKRMQGQSLFVRLKKLQSLTDNTALQEKEIGLHTLRHSIATHLLQAGMKLESISRFLGHSSLESTQIYTHLAEEA